MMDDLFRDYELIPTWVVDDSWSPFVQIATEEPHLPIRWRRLPVLAMTYSFEEICGALKVYRNNKRTRQIVFDYWSWFAAPRLLRESFKKQEEVMHA